MIETQRPEYRDELVALRDLIKRGEIERAQDSVSEPLATSFIAAGNGADIRHALERLFHRRLYPRHRRALSTREGVGRAVDQSAG